jgi:tRNA A37 threonylcarbamoyladenosine dehydratase
MKPLESFLGGTIDGVRVRRIVAELDDGRVVTIGAEPSLTPTQRRILDVLRASPVPLTRKQLTARLRYANAQGRFGVEVSRLVRSGSVRKVLGNLSTTR